MNSENLLSYNDFSITLAKDLPQGVACQLIADVSELEYKYRTAICTDTIAIQGKTDVIDFSFTDVHVDRDGDITAWVYEAKPSGFLVRVIIFND